MHLAEVTEYLLANGHSDALNYVLRQAISFYYLTSKRDRAERSQGMGMMRAAYHADQKAYEKLIKGLS